MCMCVGQHRVTSSAPNPGSQTQQRTRWTSMDVMQGCAVLCCVML